MIIKRITLETHLAEIRLINKLIFSCKFSLELVKHEVENVVRERQFFSNSLIDKLLLVFIKYVPNNFNNGMNIMLHTSYTIKVFIIHNFLTRHLIRCITVNH